MAKRSADIIIGIRKALAENFEKRIFIPRELKLSRPGKFFEVKSSFGLTYKIKKKTKQIVKFHSLQKWERTLEK